MRKGEFEFCRQVEPSPDPGSGALGRRDFFYRLGRGVGSLAFSSLLYREGFLQAADQSLNPLIPNQPHFAAKAKSCIFLFMAGAPSQMDTFDPKPKLAELHGQPIARNYGGMEKRMYVGRNSGGVGRRIRAYGRQHHGFLPHWTGQGPQQGCHGGVAGRSRNQGRHGGRKHG